MTATATPPATPPATPSASNKAHAEAFARDGYLHARGFFTEGDVREMQGQVGRYIEQVLPHMPLDAAFYEDPKQPETLLRLEKLELRSRYFHDLLHSSQLVELAGALLNDEPVAQGAQVFGKSPRIGKETPAHQDGYYFMLEPNEALTMWVPLDATDRDNGCIRYLPGTHRGEMRPHGKSETFGFSQGITDYGKADFDAEVAIEAVPGDLIAHHSMTVHRADPNRSDRRRWAMGFIFFAKRAKRDEAKVERYREELHRQWAAAGKL